MDNPDITITEQVLLAPLTAWRIGGPARYLATVRSPRGVQAALEFADSQHLPVWVLGGGSNMLISDAGLPGVVIRMRDMRVDVTARSDDASVQIGAGAPMAGTVRQLVNAGWAGLAWAEGLPVLSPSARSCPSRTRRPAAAGVSKPKSTWPPSKAASAGPLPWKGT